MTTEKEPRAAAFRLRPPLHYAGDGRNLEILPTSRFTGILVHFLQSSLRKYQG